MKVINDVEISNKYTFKKLTKILENKKPTNKTVLLLRLYIEQNINTDEMLILVKNDLKTNKKAKDFVRYEKDKPKEINSNVFTNIAQLDVYKGNHVKLIDKLKE